MTDKPREYYVIRYALPRYGSRLIACYEGADGKTTAEDIVKTHNRLYKNFPNQQYELITQIEE